MNADLGRLLAQVAGRRICAAFVSYAELLASPLTWATLLCAFVGVWLMLPRSSLRVRRVGRSRVYADHRPGACCWLPCLRWEYGGWARWRILLGLDRGHGHRSRWSTMISIAQRGLRGGLVRPRSVAGDGRPVPVPGGPVPGRGDGGRLCRGDRRDIAVRI